MTTRDTVASVVLGAALAVLLWCAELQVRRILRRRRAARGPVAIGRCCADGRVLTDAESIAFAAEWGLDVRPARRPERAP